MLKNKTIGHLFLAYSLPLRVYGKLYGGQEFSWIRLGWTKVNDDKPLLAMEMSFFVSFHFSYREF